MNNDRQASATSAPQLPRRRRAVSEPASIPVEHDNNKGFTVGYTATFSSTLVNNFHFGYISELLNLQGLQNQPFISFRGMDSITAFTPTINTHVPVKNIVDDLTKVVGRHSFQVGVN